MNTPDIPGRILSGPGPRDVRCWLKVTPIWDSKTGRTKALRVRIYTDLGREVVNIRATNVEITKIAVPQGDVTKNYPGTMWFVSTPEDVAFLPDSNAGALLLVGAKEQPRKTAQEPAEGSEG